MDWVPMVAPVGDDLLQIQQLAPDGLADVVLHLRPLGRKLGGDTSRMPEWTSK